MILTKNIQKTFIFLGLVVFFVAASQTTLQAHTEIYTTTCQGCCDNGNNTTDVKTYVDGVLASDCFTNCDGYCTCSVFGPKLGGGTDTTTTVLGTLPMAISKYFSADGSNWNISTGSVTIDTIGNATGNLWNISGYTLIGKSYSLDCDTAGNVSLTTYPGMKITAEGFSAATTPAISGIVMEEGQGASRVGITLTAPAAASIQMYDVLGRLVYTYDGLLNLQAGNNEVSLSNFDGAHAGTYFLRVSIGTDTKTQKVVVIQ